MRVGETEIIDQLERLGSQWAPLRILSLQIDSVVANGLRADALMSMEVEQGPSFRALVEVVSPGNPKNIRDRCAKLLTLLDRSSDPDLVPLIVAPYIPPSQAQILREAGVSWIDLSGNMTVSIPGRVYVERTGRPNQFPDSAPIKNVFQGTASLVVRALLLEPAGFTSLSQIVEFIRSHNGSITAGTVSKVLRSLEEELLVSRSDRRTVAADSAKLLDRLAAGYASSSASRRTAARRFATGDMKRTLRELAALLGPACACCGFYAAQLKGLVVSSQAAVYVRDMDRVVRLSRSTLRDTAPDDEFGELTVIEMKDPTPWFNVQRTGDLYVVDDLELYLEMTGDTPRGPKVADALRTRILGNGRHGQ